LSILQRRGYNPIILIGSPKNLMSIIFSLALFYVVDNRTIDVIIPPYYFGPGKKSLKGKEYLLDKLISEYGQKAIRIWLGSAIIGAEKKQF